LKEEDPIQYLTLKNDFDLKQQKLNQIILIPLIRKSTNKDREWNMSNKKLNEVMKQDLEVM
jgi:hypothetical protein